MESGAALVRLPRSFGPARGAGASGLAERLASRRRLTSRPAAPAGRGGAPEPVADQRAIIARYEAEVRAAHPGLTRSELRRLTSRFVAPVAVAPHVAGPRST